MAEVFEIGRRAFDELLGSGVLRDQCRGYGDYVVVSCMARFARSPRRFWVVENFEVSYWACHRADGCQEVSLFNVATGGADYCHYYEVWHIVDDEDLQPKHDPEHVNDCGKKSSRHVSVKFDGEESETDTLPEPPTKEELEELDRIFPPDGTITDTLPRAVWSMYAETFNVLGVYDVPATLDVLVQMDDNVNGKRCLRFECDGVRLRRVGLYPRANLIEYSWTVEQPTDFVGLAAFMQKMSGYGCSVSLMTTKGRDE